MNTRIIKSVLNECAEFEKLNCPLTTSSRILIWQYVALKLKRRLFFGIRLSSKDSIFHVVKFSVKTIRKKARSYSSAKRDTLLTKIRFNREFV